MKYFDASDLERYLVRDDVGRALAEATRPGDAEVFGCHRWLRDSAPKRMVFAALYGDLLEGPRQRVLDVGGGITALSRSLGARHDYSLVDFLAHDDRDAARALFEELDAKWIDRDWDEIEAWGSEPFDVIVANDIFPNVDQRLLPFLDAALPRCRELRLSLTWYDPPRFYRVRRTDADEILHVMAWGHQQLGNTLAPFADRTESRGLDELASARASLYPNGRQIGVLTLRGDAP